MAAIPLGLIWLGAARSEAQSRYAIASALSVILVAWLAIAEYLGAANVYFVGTGTVTPTLAFGLLVPLMVTAAGIWLSRSARSLISAIPLSWMVAAQIYRLEGAIFLVLWLDGRLPWQFALPAGIGDVTTAGVAIVVATLLARKANSARKAVYVWSIFGIADLILAIVMGIMTSPGRLHILALDTPNFLLSSYPLVMIPTFGVPLALMLHSFVLWRLPKPAT